ncbi:MAG: bile acid:sodium symporter [Chloroflexota bacterium]
MFTLLKALGGLFQNRNFILVLAVVLGLTFGESVAAYAEPLILPLLALVMTLSAVDVTSRELLSLKKLYWPVVSSIILNYLVLGGAIILLAWWLIPDDELRTGFIILAAVPPAPAVLPFTHTLGGNVRFSLIGVTGAYLAALIITPLVITLWLGTGFFNPVKLLLILAELVLIPIAASRILLITSFISRIKASRGVIVNWSFFIIVFALIGLNRQALFGEMDMLLRMFIIAVVTSFVMCHLLELAARVLHLTSETTISVILMGTLKNYSLAGGILLSLFTTRSAIPVSVCLILGIFMYVWLGFYFRKGRQKITT